MGIGLSDVTTVRSINPNRCRFIGGSDARIIVSRDEAARIQLSNRQGRRLSSCGPFGASTRELATNNGRRCKINDLHDWYPGVHESVRRSVAKLYARFLGTHFRSRQSSRGFPRSDPSRCSGLCFDEDGRLGQVPNRSTAAPSEFVRLSQPAAPMTHVTKPNPHHHVRESIEGSSEPQTI
jgi:hypothetical protein